MNRCKKCNSFLSFGNTELCTDCKKNRNSKLKFLFIGIFIGFFLFFLIEWIVDSIDHIIYKNNILTNDFTEVNCSRENNTVSCDVLINKENISFDYISLSAIYDTNLEYIDYICDNNVTVTQGMNNDKATLHMTVSEHDISKNGNKVLTIIFDVKKELENSTINFEDIYLSSYTDENIIYYNSDKEIIIDVNQLSNSLNN